MEFNKDKLILAGISILIGMLIMAVIDGKFSSKDNKVTKPDTSYNKVKLDSIKVQINKHDTTIYKLKIKVKDDIEKSYMLNDSDAIHLFKSLSTSDSIK